MNSSAIEFDQIASTIFYPIYPVIADQILKRVTVDKKGQCLDVGCGSGYLGIELAKKTDMMLCFYDIDPEALALADNNLKEECLHNRSHTCLGTVEDIPFTDETFDLVISRGSLFFWEDKIKAFNEILRVLKPGGWAYLGGGFGNSRLKQEIDHKMLKIDEAWLRKAAKRKGSRDYYKQLLEDTQIKKYQVIDDETGLWILFEK